MIDEVFGSLGAGGFAEYVCAHEKYFALKPAGISFAAAAAAPVVGFTALQGLRDTGQIRAGQKVLVNGAAGGVGTFAVQIAKSYGTEVTGICVLAGFTTLPRLFEHMLLGPLLSKKGGKKVSSMGIAKVEKQDLLFIKELLGTGKVVPVIDRHYPLSETAEAIRYLEQGHARGKVIITVEQNNGKPH